MKAKTSCTVPAVFSAEGHQNRILSYYTCSWGAYKEEQTAISATRARLSLFVPRETSFIGGEGVLSPRCRSIGFERHRNSWGERRIGTFLRSSSLISARFPEVIPLGYVIYGWVGDMVTLSHRSQRRYLFVKFRYLDSTIREMSRSVSHPGDRIFIRRCTQAKSTLPVLLRRLRWHTWWFGV